jgi:hypothetical protein
MQDSPPPHSTSASPFVTTGTPGLEAKYSCLTCHRRKVKCDRGRPCGNCLRSKTDCEYKAPPAPRRKKKTTDQLLLAKLQRYEEHLRKLGVDIDEVKKRSVSVMSQEGEEDEEEEEEESDEGLIGKPVKKEPGTLVLDSGKSRYFEK